MGRKCSVEDCLSESNRPEDTGVTFHKVPMHSDIRPKWLSLCRIPEDKKSIKIIYVCSRHFLRVDFCNFKGKKYMLRQGVLPSVFPWDKSKLESIKTGKPETEKHVKEELPSEDPPAPVVDESPDTKPNVPKPKKIKEKPVDVKVETDQEIPSTSSNGLINFAINTRIEALDNNNVWYPARIIEQDDEENEVLIRFEKFSSKFNEWICKDSPRLRPIQTSSKKNTIEQYSVGDRCLATWSDSRKFPATVTKVLLNDTYEVLFDDGFVKNLRAHRMCKSSPLFDPILSSKQERREKKRKINIAELFGKRPRLDGAEDKTKTPAATTQKPSIDSTSPEESLDFWLPQWEDGKPVGVESTIETVDGPRKSVIVADPRLPEGWAKHLTQKSSSTGKWEVFIVGPDNRNFKNKAEIKNYLEETKVMKFSPSMFDFRHKQRYKKKEPEFDSFKLEPPVQSAELETAAESTPDEEEGKNYLKIPLVDNSYHCPIEGCGKTYRRENLAQMHVKHYHPEYTKFLDSTPNVADLAYARTVGESLDKSPGLKNITPKQIAKTLRSTPKTLPPPPPPSTTPQVESEVKPQSPIPPKSTPLPSTALKDSEIIKLLNTNKSPDPKKESTDQIRPLPSGLPLNMYPDIKLKDLLVKSEGIPPRDEINIRTLSTTRPPAGIKTLLPVRPENKQQQNPPELETNFVHKPKTSFKRKRGFIDTYETPKGNEFHDHSYLPQEPQQNLISNSNNNNYNNTIIEGGKVIKIVRMKQEEIINCTCGYTEEDGLMIQCDLCLCWQHAFCNNIERESQVPEKYVCLICQNPAKQRTSLKYFHDQDWLKHGVLASTSFHAKDEEVLSKRFAKLKKSHDLSGGLLEVKDFVNTLKVKLKIAEAKNHPKLYLWSRAWDKPSLPEKEATSEDEKRPKEEEDEEEKAISENTKQEEEGSNNESMLMMMLKESKQEKPEVFQAPKIPQPEAAIDSADCRLNLLEHILHSQTLVEERLDSIEKQINELDDSACEDTEDYPRTRQTLSMMIRDLTTLQELSQRVTV